MEAMKAPAIVAIVAACFVVPPRVALAQQPQITMKQRADAKRLFNQARLAYQNGDYEEAIIKWQQSYDLSKEALIFESIANAYERLGKMDKALENLKKWRQSAPWKEHKALDSRIQRLEERVKADEAERKKKDELDRQRRERDDAEAKRKREEDERKQQDARGPSGKAILSYSLMGVGGALVIAGVTLDVVAGLKRPNKATACAEANGQLLCKEADRAAIQQTNAMAIAGDVGWIVGGASVVTGLVLLFTVAPRSDGGDKAQPTAVLPWLDRRGGGAVVQTSF
jgi:tetratricopeptide (TPR) repeat protein